MARTRGSAGARGRDDGSDWKALREEVQKTQKELNGFGETIKKLGGGVDAVVGGVGGIVGGIAQVEQAKMSLEQLISKLVLPGLEEGAKRSGIAQSLGIPGALGDVREALGTINARAQAESRLGDVAAQFARQGMPLDNDFLDTVAPLVVHQEESAQQGRKLAEDATLRYMISDDFRSFKSMLERNAGTSRR